MAAVPHIIRLNWHDDLQVSRDLLSESEFSEYLKQLNTEWFRFVRFCRRLDADNELMNSASMFIISEYLYGSLRISYSSRIYIPRSIAKTKTAANCGRITMLC